MCTTLMVGMSALGYVLDFVVMALGTSTSDISHSSNSRDNIKDSAYVALQVTLTLYTIACVMYSRRVDDP
jgi:hypothetical protein